MTCYNDQFHNDEISQNIDQAFLLVSGDLSPNKTTTLNQQSCLMLAKIHKEEIVCSHARQSERNSLLCAKVQCQYTLTFSALYVWYSVVQAWRWEPSRETSSHATRKGKFAHSHLRLLSHCGLILA